MNTQMSLEEYKKRALDYCRKTSPAFIEILEDSRKVSNDEWRQLMEDFSPEVAVQGMASGLI